VNGTSDDQNSSGESRRARDPAWLRSSDLDSLVQRFAPLDAAQVRHVARVLAEGSTPVEMLILRLVAVGLPKPAARRLIAELRGLRERPRPRATQGRGSPAAEVSAALNAAALSYLLRPGDDEQAASAIVRQVKWSMVRARWFMSMNRDTVRRMADRLGSE